MAELQLPHPRWRRSFLAAMSELAAEGRTGDRSMLGEDLAEHGGSRASSGSAASTCATG